MIAGFTRRIRRLVQAKYAGPLVVECFDFGVVIRPYRSRKGGVSITWGAIYEEAARRRADQLARERAASKGQRRRRRS